MTCWAQTAFALTILMLGTASMVGACGRKGPLYLPEEPVATASAVVPETGADIPTPTPTSKTAAPAEPTSRETP
jgi:predicted small lipoprotein YifL